MPEFWTHPEISPELRASRARNQLAAMSAIAAGACLLAAACAVGPRYQRPDVPTPPAYKELQPGSQWKVASPGGGQLSGDWWKMFGDAQLSRFEESVSVSNQTVKQAEAQYRQARALAALDHAQYYPTITSQPAITTSSQSQSLGSHRLGSTYFTLYNLPFGASWEPNFWNRIGLSVENATDLAQTSAADLENIRLSLRSQLAADYFALEGQDMEQHLLRDTIAAYEKALQLTNDRHASGVASRVDVAQAESQLDSTRAQLTDIAVTRSQLEHAIAVLVGQQPETFSIPAGEIHGLPPQIPVGIPSQLLERRPDIAGSERQVAAANAEIGLARVAYYPTVSLSLTTGLQAAGISSLFNWPSRFFSLGPAAAQTLLDFGRRRAAAQQAEATYDALVASYRQTVLAAFQEVEDNLSALQLLAEEAVQQDAAVKGAVESLDLELDRYKAGTVSYLDVITSQTIALTDQRLAVQILQRRMTAAVQLIAALGGGWNLTSLPTATDIRTIKTP